MSELPLGTVTFMLTDLEGSTRLWELQPAPMETALVAHDAMLRETVESHRGVVVDHGGDGMLAVFASPSDAVAAGLDFELRVATSARADVAALRPRVALHAAEGVLRADGRYRNQPLNRCARLLAAGHGGQMLVSESVEVLVRGALPTGVDLVALGEHRLRDLSSPVGVFQLVHPDLRREFPPLRSLEAFPGNLPVQRDRFVGRAASIEQITGLVLDDAVVTLTGPAGVGKTRLGLQVAAVLQPEFSDGAWFVDLAPVNTADRVAAVFLETLGYTLAAGEDDVAGLCARLRRRRLLLVVDNCEHLVASVATVVDAISRIALEVRVIATSREGLGVPAERLVPVAPLATDADGDAVELFVTRVRGSQPEFAFDAAVTPTVVELCRRLDGIPLAIELAAARARSIAPVKILERLDERFRMLTGGSRTAVARHQTLQAAVDWSYELLTDAERAVLDRLSVFAGSFTLDAAEAVASDAEIDAFEVLDHVSALVDKSLVVADPGGATYRLLETIRQYAAGRLADSETAEDVRARHAAYYRTLATAIAPELTGPGELAAIERLSVDIENLRLALEWNHHQGQAATVVDVLWDLAVYWYQRGHGLEVIARLEATIDALGEDHLHLCHAHGLLAWLKASVGYGGIPEHAERSAAHAALAGIPAPQISLFGLATYYMSSEGNTERAIELTQTAAAAAQADGDPYMVVWAQTSRLIFTALVAPGADETLRLADEVRLDTERIGSDTLRQQWLLGMALALRAVDPDRSLTLLEEAAELVARASLRDSVANVEFFRGLELFTGRRYGDAATTLRRALVGFHDMGNRRGMLNVLSAVTGMANRTGRPEAATALLAGLRAARDEYGLPGSAIERGAEERIEEHLHHVGSDGVAHHFRSLDIEATIDLALNTLNDIAAAESA